MSTSRMKVLNTAAQLLNVWLVMRLVDRVTGVRAAGMVAALLWLVNSALGLAMSWTSAYNQILWPCFLLAACHSVPVASPMPAAGSPAVPGIEEALAVPFADALAQRHARLEHLVDQQRRIVCEALGIVAADVERSQRLVDASEIADEVVRGLNRRQRPAMCRGEMGHEIAGRELFGQDALLPLRATVRFGPTPPANAAGGVSSAN